MDIVNNIKLVKDILSPSQLEKLEKHAFFFQDRSKIQFKIHEVTEDSITVSVSQGDARKAFVVSPKELQKVARGVFGLYFPDRQLHIKLGKYKEGKFVAPKPVKAPDPGTAKIIRERLVDPETNFNGKSIIESRLLIERFVSLDKLRKMEKHAAFFNQRSKIIFKVVEVQDPIVLVTAKQVDPSPRNTVGPREIDTITRSFFEFYLDDKEVRLVTKRTPSIKRVPPSTDQIIQKIKDKGISAEQIAEETGLNLVTLNAWFEGRQKMSTLARAMFFYMLK